MVKRVGHLAAVGLALQIVVADFAGHVHGVGNVAVFNRAEHLVVLISPDSGIEIGLELEAHADFVGFFLGQARHLFVSLGKRAEQILHVVPHLVGYHIGIGEVASAADAAFHGLEKVEVDIHGLVG